ncbi:hypothetical protein T11_628 [Trichinella zimbabwensis]|uniref:Uncharacterized protein n=1 Tax=Trichinella zimbabwensis TaxID=268475 RepID=A0A0V1H935_9BILA|nr:hypothetical protein T11_628 [Trichinella zimbabwensis]
MKCQSHQFLMENDYYFAINNTVHKSNPPKQSISFQLFKQANLHPTSGSSIEQLFIGFLKICQVVGRQFHLVTGGKIASRSGSDW